jgi:hypothetical protein
MITATVDIRAGEHPYEPNAALVYCGHFGDRVAERVCLDLKKELTAWWNGDATCRGCCRRWLR